MTFLSDSRLQTSRSTQRRISLRDLIALRHERRSLRQLDDIALRDIGLTREAAETEARRWFWDIPQDRR